MLKKIIYISYRKIIQLIYDQLFLFVCGLIYRYQFKKLFLHELVQYNDIHFR